MLGNMHGFGRGSGMSSASLMKRAEFGRGNGMSLASLMKQAEISRPVEPEDESSNVLQITKCREEIINKISSHHVTMISAETGSGKVRRCLYHFNYVDFNFSCKFKFH